MLVLIAGPEAIIAGPEAMIAGSEVKLGGECNDGGKSAEIPEPWKWDCDCWNGVKIEK